MDVSPAAVIRPPTLQTAKAWLTKHKLAVLVVILIVVAFVSVLVQDRGFTGIVLLLFAFSGFAVIYKLQPTRGSRYSGYDEYRSATRSRFGQLGLVLFFMGMVGIAAASIFSKAIPDEMFATFGGVLMALVAVVVIVAYKTSTERQELAAGAASRRGNESDDELKMKKKMWRTCNDMVLNSETVQKAAIVAGIAFSILAAVMSTNHSRYLAFLAVTAFTVSVLSNNYSLWITVLAVTYMIVNASYLLFVDHVPKIGGTPKDSSRGIVLMNIAPAVLIAVVHFFLYAKLAKAIPGVSFMNIDVKEQQERQLRDITEGLAEVIALYKQRVPQDAQGMANDIGPYLDSIQNTVNEIFVVEGMDDVKLNVLKQNVTKVFNEFAQVTDMAPLNPALPPNLIAGRIKNLVAFLRRDNLEVVGLEGEAADEAAGEAAL